MKRIIYSSKADASVDQKELEDILTASRRNNRAIGVTGILLFGRGLFIQVLEGDEEVIDRMVMHIEEDGRHFDFELLYDADTETRSFADWDMAYKVLDDETLDVLGGTLSLEDREALIERIRDDGEIAKNFVAECARDMLRGPDVQPSP